MKYQLTRDELSTMALYMTMQTYKKVKLWVVSAIAALFLTGIFQMEGGVFTWLACYMILLVLYFLLFYCNYSAGLRIYCADRKKMIQA